MGERTDDMTSQDPEHIHAEIARTREDMTETIDEIQERLSPRNLQEQATERVREATIGRVEQAGENVKETGMSMWETVKQNPIPAALVGVGLGWLYMSRGESTSRTEYQYPYGQTRVSSSYTTGEMQQGAGQMQESAMEQAQELGGQVRERTGQMGSMAQGQVQNVRSQVSNMFQESPLVVGAIAFGAGAVVGMSIPETRQEHQLMGEQRDQLLEQAKSTAQDTMQRAEQVAEHTVEEARTAAEEEAREQGLRE